MVKVGPPENGQFSPFTQIQEGLASLSQPIAESGQAAVEERQSRATTRPTIAVAPERAQRHLLAQEEVTPALITMKRFKVSPEESAEMEQSSLRLSVKLGVKVDFSKITRALWQVYLKHEEDIFRNADVGMIRRRPANDDSVGLAELDEQLAQILNEGFMVASRRPINRS